MRTTVDLPGELMERAKHKAEELGISLSEFFTDAIAAKLNSERPRRTFPVIGPDKIKKMRLFTPEEIDEAMLG